MLQILCKSRIQENCTSSTGKSTPCIQRGQIIFSCDLFIYFICVERFFAQLSWIWFYCNEYYLLHLSLFPFFFLIFIFIFERCKQIERRILQWNAIRELYISICKIYLKKESTCPFVHLQLQTEKISEERSRWHRRALWKKVNHLKESLLQMRRFWHSEEIRVVVIMTPNHSWVEPIYFTFHSSLLISEKSENDREGRKLIQREVFHGWMELKKVEWTFSVLENVHLHLQIALLQFTWQRKLFRAFKG